MNASLAMRCPRCGARFGCGAQGPAPCACSGVTLPAVVQAQLRQQFNGCLCLRCLQQLAAACAADTAQEQALLADRQAAGAG